MQHINYLENMKLTKSLNNNLFFKTTCSQEKFLNSQIPFYYAVEHWTKLLLKLMLKIPNLKQQLVILENINDEYGNGDESLVHTNTFMQYLNA